MLECGGNGRSQFTPEARGNQWTTGGAGCPEWTGVRLGDVLKAAGLKSSAVYTAHYGADLHLSGDATKPTISRGVRLAKAMEEHTLIAFKLNGKDLPAIHGGPVRLIVPGWAGSASHKWLTRIWIRRVKPTNSIPSSRSGCRRRTGAIGRSPRRRRRTACQPCGRDMSLSGA